MTTIVLTEVRWGLIRILLEKLEDATNNFDHENAFVRLSLEEAMGLGGDSLVMDELRDVMKRKYPDRKPRLEICLRLTVA